MSKIIEFNFTVLPRIKIHPNDQDSTEARVTIIFDDRDSVHLSYILLERDGDFVPPLDYYFQHALIEYKKAYAEANKKNIQREKFKIVS